HSRRGSGNRLFDEHGLTVPDGFLEMNRAEAGRSGEDHNVRKSDGFFVASKVGELVVGRNSDLLAMLGLERSQSFLQLLGPDISKSDQFGFARSAERLAG